MKTYFYDILVDDNSPDILFVSVVSEDFWRNHGCMDDQTPEELIDPLESHGFLETMESVFEFEGTRKEAKKILESLGMRTDDGFTKFLHRGNKER